MLDKRNLEDKLKRTAARRKARMVLSVSQGQLERELELKDTVQQLVAELKHLPNQGLRDKFLHAIEDVAKDGDLSRVLDLTRYVRDVVPLDEFLYSPTYLGIDDDELYPGVLETLEALDTEQYVECVMKGAIGGGKTTTANLSMARQIYKISCMRNPQQTFGIQQHSSIVFTIQSVRLTTAKQAVFQEFGKFLDASPYFREIYPYNRRITSRMKFLRHHVEIMPVSSSTSGAISMNVIGGLLDEVNFMQRVKNSKQQSMTSDEEYHQAKELYLTLSKRRRSRFMQQGKLPGTLFLVSSSRYPDDFTEEKAAEAEMCGGDDPEIYVYSKSLWDSKGRNKYSNEAFRVLVGDERMRSRILNQDEPAPSGKEIIEVPVDFRREFEKDIDGSIRDLAGHTTLATTPFIRSRESLFDCMDLADKYAYQSVVGLEDIDLEVSVPSIIPSRVRSDVQQMRVAHIDLSVSRDSAGLAVGHVAGTRTIERTIPGSNNKIVETLPVIAYDLIIRIVPPRDGEIDFGRIRQILYDLRDGHGLPIKVVTTDGFQSVDTRQILRKHGFLAEYLSVDRDTQPYKTLRSAFYDRRIILPRHQTLIKELTELEWTRKGAKEMVDHRPRGSKDVADAVCGVAAYLMTRRSAWTTAPSYAGEGGLLLYGNRTGVANAELDEAPASTLGAEGASSGFKRRKPNRRSIVSRLQPHRK